MEVKGEWVEILHIISFVVGTGLHVSIIPSPFLLFNDNYVAPPNFLLTL